MCNTIFFQYFYQLNKFFLGSDFLEKYCEKEKNYKKENLNTYVQQLKQQLIDKEIKIANYQQEIKYHENMKKKKSFLINDHQKNSFLIENHLENDSENLKEKIKSIYN